MLPATASASPQSLYWLRGAASVINRCSPAKNSRAGAAALLPAFGPFEDSHGSRSPPPSAAPTCANSRAGTRTLLVRDAGLRTGRERPHSPVLGGRGGRGDTRGLRPGMYYFDKQFTRNLKSELQTLYVAKPQCLMMRSRCVVCTRTHSGTHIRAHMCTRTRSAGKHTSLGRGGGNRGVIAHASQ